MKTYDEIEQDIQNILGGEDAEQTLQLYLKKHLVEFPEDLRNEIFPLLFEAELVTETKILEEKNKMAEDLLSGLEIADQVLAALEKKKAELAA